MAQESEHFDLVVIGSGPAGYVGAIRAAQLGMRVACVEREHLGGVCLNWGCIPTKALLSQAALYEKLTKDAGSLGINAEGVSHDWSRVIARSREVAGQLNQGVGSLLKKNGVTHVEGHARISKPEQVEVYADPSGPSNGGEPEKRLDCTHILIATGAGPKPLPFAPFDGERILSYKEAMVLDEQPERLVIVGAGYIGMEFAYLYNAFGTEVTVVEMEDRVLPAADPDISKGIAKAFRKRGITMRTGVKTSALEAGGSGVEATIEPRSGEGEAETIAADRALVAIGVSGRFDGLFDENLGVRVVDDHIKVDHVTYETSRPGIYAAGDVSGTPWLAHKASEEAVNCVEQLAGERPAPIRYDLVPGCIYCHPQGASVGMTEPAAREAGYDVRKGQFPFQASGRAQAEGATEGFVKILSDGATGEVLGAHIVGESATELIHEIAVAMRLEATVGELIATMHAHPTLAEAVHEAALGVEDRTLHA